MIRRPGNTSIQSKCSCQLHCYVVSCLSYCYVLAEITPCKPLCIERGIPVRMVSQMLNCWVPLFADDAFAWPNCGSSVHTLFRTDPNVSSRFAICQFAKGMTEATSAFLIARPCQIAQETQPRSFPHGFRPLALWIDASTHLRSGTTMRGSSWPLFQEICSDTTREQCM